MLGFLIAIGVYLGLFGFLRWFGSRENPTIVVVQPANTTGIILLKPNTVERDKDGKIIGVNNDGGDIIDVIHTAPGRKIDKSDHDPMNWEIKPGREKRSLLYYLTSLQIIGVFRYLRINDIRTFRWGRRDNEDAYHVMPKTDHTRFPHYQGQHDIEMKKVETREIIKFDLRLNLTTEEKFPVRVRYRTADAYAQLTVIASDHVIDVMGQVDPKTFIEGGPEEKEKGKKNLKQMLTDSFQEDGIQNLIQRETGLLVRNVSLPDFDFDPATRELLEKLTKAELTAEADIKTAEGKKRIAILLAEADKQSRVLRNDADEDRVKRVILPASVTPLSTRVVEAEAYRDNPVVHTSVRGGTDGVVLPVGGK